MQVDYVGLKDLSKDEVKEEQV